MTIIRSGQEKIRKMLAEEQKIIKRTAKEVTVDFPAVRAEIRAELLEELLKKI